MSKKIIALLLALFLVGGLLSGCGQKAPAPGAPEDKPAEEPDKKVETKFVNIATGGTAGTYMPLGAAFAEIWNKNVEGVNATAETTGASVANVNLLKEGKVEVIFVQNDISYYAENGTEVFDGNKYADIRGLATLYPETVQIVTIEGKGINSLADLKGKKVAVGAAGSGTEANARQILAAAGITYDDINVQYLSFADAANNLKDGNIHAAFVTAGFPTAAIQDISAQHKVKLVPVEDEMSDKLVADYPFYTKINIPAGTYKDQAEDVKAVAVSAMLAVSSDMDEELAYQLVKTLYDNLDRVELAHTVGKMIRPETGQDGMSITLHPGAKRFFDGK